MTQNTELKVEKVLWSELLPFEFKHRLKECPVVYLPLGICEPHGQISAFGLDTIKAEYLCAETAHLAKGIVAPPLGYQIHESGYHAAWLEEVVGEENPHMTSIPPFVFLHFFLYQLRAFVNAGFRGIVVLTGHAGGNQVDLRRVAETFAREVPVQLWVGSDSELVEGKFRGDHAGKYEISQLMYLRPELTDLSKLRDESLGGRLALGDDACEASSELGEKIIKDCLKSLVNIVQSLQKGLTADRNPVKINYEQTEMLWAKIIDSRESWETLTPRKNQKAVSEKSQWKDYERPHF